MKPRLPAQTPVVYHRPLSLRPRNISVVRIFKLSDCWYKQGIICNALDSAENVRMNKSEVFVTVCKNENCRGLKNTRARFRGRTNIILLFQLLSRSLFFTFLQKR